MKFALEPAPPGPEDFPISDVKLGELCLLTAAPNWAHRIGAPVVGAGEFVVVLACNGLGRYTIPTFQSGFRARRLRPGEAATFTGE